MENWLTPSIIATTAATLILSLVYWYLYHQERMKYMRTWAMGWLFYSLRMAFMLVIVQGASSQAWGIANQFCSLMNAFLILGGVYQFLGGRFPLYWTVLTGGALVWLGVTAALDFSFMTESLPLYLYNGAVFMWAGVHWLRRFHKEGNLNVIIGAVFLLWGLHKWNYPFLRGVTAFAPWGYLLASLFATIVALGIILVYYEVNRRLLKESAVKSELLSGELYESREMFKALVEFTEAIHWSVELETGRFTYVSPQAEKITGYSSEEWTDFQFWSSMVHEEDRSWAVAYSRTNIEQQQDHEFIYRIRTKDGRVRWLRDIVKVITKGDKPVKLIGIMLEITSAKETEESLERSLREKEMLIQEIHHRVKNNMQIISSLLDLQSSKISNEEVRRFFQESQNRIQAMALVHERLYKDDTLEETDMKEYIDSLIGYLRSTTYSERNIRFETDIEQVRFVLDAVIPVGLILNELVTNSLKHAFPNGKAGIIWVTLNTVQVSSAELTVADNGRGLPEGYDPCSGDTLGMNLVRALVKQLEGTLEIERTPLLQFTIRFPVARSAPAIRP